MSARDRVLSRRRFAGAALALLVPRRWLASAAPGDPRLDARPVRPWRPVEVGATRLGSELQRGADLFVPRSYSAHTPAPLVVALHGAGGSAAAWRRWQPVSEEHGFVLLAPDSRGRTWDRVFGDIGPDARFIESALRHTFERCAIDPDRIALAGFSDGASYALSLGPSNGDLFTHLIAFSPGFSMPEDPIVGKPSVFMSHGDRDGVLPVTLTRTGLAPMFEMDGYDVRYVEFAGGHEMPAPVVDDALEWFLG
jgi:phospholipase/carboxylesterase